MPSASRWPWSPRATTRRSGQGLPHLHELVDRVRESVNLVVLAGTEARFIASVECAQVLRVGSREGRTLPAHLTSGGKAVLAALPPEEVAALYRGSDEVDLARLRRELALARQRGFAINDQCTETGLTALGTVIRDASNSPVAAVAAAMPTARFHRDRVTVWVSALTEAASRIEQALRAAA